MMVDGRPRRSRVDADVARDGDRAFNASPPTSPNQPVSASGIVPAPQSAAVKVVPLFREQGPSETFSHPLPASPVDWPGTLQRIRDVGTQVRRERQLAQDIVKQSRSLIQRSEMRADEAEKRAAVAEAEASAASLRAASAEKKLRLAEERAQHAEDQAQIARAGEEEAQLWLRRLYACLRREFDGLGENPR